MSKAADIILNAIDIADRSVFEMPHYLFCKKAAEFIRSYLDETKQCRVDFEPLMGLVYFGTVFEHYMAADKIGNFSGDIWVHLAIDYGNTKTDDDKGDATDVWVDLIMLNPVMIRDLFRNLLDYEKKRNGI